jgi:hypothetical protein
MTLLAKLLKLRKEIDDIIANLPVENQQNGTNLLNEQINKYLLVCTGNNPYIIVSATNLYNGFLEFSNISKEELTITMFGLILRKCFGQKVVKKKTKRGVDYKISG